jgi:hypothetical protein
LGNVRGAICVIPIPGLLKGSRLPVMALNGHRRRVVERPLSGEERKSHFRAVRSAF